MKENGLPMKILPSKSLHRKVYYKKYNCSMLLNAVSVQKYLLQIWHVDLIAFEKVCQYFVFIYLISIFLFEYLIDNSTKMLKVGVRVMVFNATFNNISIILWQSVLLVEETRISGENHRSATSH